jgi:hypothetical protein
LSCIYFKVSRDSSVGITTRLRTGRPSKRGSLPSTGNVRNISATHLDSDVVRTRDRFSGIKRHERETDHSFLSSAEVNNGGAVPPLPLMTYGVMLN